MLEKILVIIFVAGLASAVPRPQGVKSKTPSGQVDICSLPAVRPSPIACAGFFSKWTFNSTANACQPFVYGGCGGTENLFNSESDCLAKCGSKVNRNDDTTKADPCLLPKISGDCRAHIPSFFFDSSSGNCQSFVYTGCKGNDNRFANENECLTTCKAHVKAGKDAATPAPVKAKNEVTGEGLSRQERCSLPPTKTAGAFGCLAFIPSWTFNSTSGVCEPYVYGGCGKTANLYTTESECKATCVEPETRIINPRQDTCLLPVERGPCFAFMPRFAFIKEKNRCEFFTYGGCRGNGNNFKSADECYGTCGGDLPSQVPACEQVTCPASNQRLIDRGCRPEYKGKACCPTSFTCPEERREETGVCWYRGVSYKIGEDINQISEDDACQTHCSCIASAEHNGGATIKCHTIYCDEPYRPVGKTGCALVTRKGACCSSYECLEDVPRNSTCTFNDKEYLPGQTIPTGNPCKWCKCTEGFDGLDGPGCSDVQCLVENRIGCVPVYVSGACCPISYKCLRDAELRNNETQIIRISPKPNVQGVTTLPMALTPEGRSVEEEPVIPERCKQPKETGPCKRSEYAFYFNAAIGDCEFFYYGGCKGNDNRFESFEECRNTCQIKKRIIKIESAAKPVPIAEEKPKQNQTCLLPKEPGPCRMSLPSFYYDSAQKQCLPFYYGGCRGNANRFVSLEACQKACDVSSDSAASRSSDLIPDQETKAVAADRQVTTPATPALPPRCLQPRQSGPCKMSLESFYYDVERKDCFPFYYGGCRGNENRFDTIGDCRSSCKLERNQTRPAVCLLEANPGPCKGHVLTYFFNSRTENCETFWYGGCHGNQNRFETESDCQSKCGLEVTAQDNKQETKKLSKCDLPADIGPCRGHKERFFFDKVEKKCKVFGFGGCLGNANNFATEEECLKACTEEKPSEDLSALPAGRARARGSSARARARVIDNEIEQGPPGNYLHCRLGNVTFALGDKMTESSDPCEECVCSTPPELSCTRTECPPYPDIPNAICKTTEVAGQCCPVIECVSANPPSIDVCEGVQCTDNERCEVQDQESADGSWMPPIGVCVKNTTSQSDVV